MDKPIIFFDIESTGTSVTKDKIIQLSAIKTDIHLVPIEPYKKILVNPKMAIPEGATAVHGITDDMVKDKPEFKQYASAMFEFFKDCNLGGFNIKKFDVPLLSEEFNRCGLDFPNDDVEIFDVYNVFTKFERRDLSAAYKYYTGNVLENAHDAEVDNIATLTTADCQLFKHGITVKDAFEITKGDNLNVDFAGTIVLKDGVPCFNIGSKTKGKPVTSDYGFAEWMLKNDFTANTKKVINQILSGKWSSTKKVN